MFSNFRKIIKKKKLKHEFIHSVSLKYPLNEICSVSMNAFYVLLWYIISDMKLSMHNNTHI